MRTSTSLHFTKLLPGDTARSQALASEGAAAMSFVVGGVYYRLYMINVEVWGMTVTFLKKYIKQSTANSSDVTHLVGHHDQNVFGRTFGQYPPSAFHGFSSHSNPLFGGPTAGPSTCSRCWWPPKRARMAGGLWQVRYRPSFG